MAKPLIAPLLGLALAGCASLPLDASDAAKIERALQRAMAIYCGIPQADRDRFRRSLAERHGVVLPRLIVCPGDTSAPAQSARGPSPDQRKVGFSDVASPQGLLALGRHGAAGQD